MKIFEINSGCQDFWVQNSQKKENTVEGLQCSCVTFLEAFANLSAAWAHRPNENAGSELFEVAHNCGDKN